MKKKLLLSSFKNGALFSMLMLVLGLSQQQALAQCTNSSSYGSTTAPTSGTNTISTCSYQEEYSTLNSVAANTVYSCNISAGGYVTIHQGTPSGPVIGYGTPPLSWTSTVSGTYYAHWNTNASCGTTTGCVTTSITFIATLPSTPPTPTQDPTTPTCASGSALSVAGSPGVNEAWYWQTTATGTSMAIPYSGPYTVFANGTYYLRTYNSSNSYWSANSSSVTVSNFPTATTPPAPTPAQNPACMSTTLTAAAAPGGITYYWQTVANGSSMSSPASTPLTANATGTYYLAAYDNTSLCWSSTSSASVTIQTIIPPAALASPAYYNYCSSASSMPVSAQVPPPSTNTGSCTASATASGYDGSSVTATVNNFSCAPTTIVSASMDAVIGQYCALYGWYSYNVIVNGTTVMTGLCDQNNIDLTPYLPLTSVSIVSNDDDGYAFDFVNMSLTVHVSYITAPYTISWFSAPSGGSALGTGTTIEGLGTSVLPTATSGAYQFYAANNQDACPSASRTLVTVNVTEVLASLNPVNATCNGGNNGSFTLGPVQCGTPPFLYSVNGGAFGAIPTNLIAGTYSIVMQDAAMGVSAPISVVITEPAMPSSLNATNVTYYNGTLGWTTTGNETAWTIIYGPAGFDPATSGTVIPSATNPYTISGDLTAATDYDFYVFSQCGPVPDTAGPLSFSTDPGFFTWDSQCGPGFIDIHTTGTALNLTDDATVSITTVNPVSVQGDVSNNITVSNNGYVYWGGITLDAWDIDLDDEEGNVYWQETTISGDNYLIVEWYNRPRYATVSGQDVTFEMLINQTTNEVYYVYDDAIFGGSQSSNDNGLQGTIAIYGPSDAIVSDYDNTYLTNNSCVHFYNALCPNVTNFSSVITSNDANLDWDAGLYGETSWTLVYGPQGFDPAALPSQAIGTQNLSSSDASFAGTLSQLTTYDVYIYSECQADNLTSDGFFYEFTTLPYCSNPSTLAGTSDVDSLEVTWNWVSSDPGTYDATSFNIQYGMNGMTSTEVIANGINYADTVVDASLLAGGVYQVYVQAVCANTNDTSAWVGPITVVMPLSNDTVCGAENLALATTYTFNNVGATVSLNETNIAPPATGAQTTTGWANSTLNGTTWFKFVAPPSGSVRINNTAINYNGQIAVYDVADCGDFNSNFLLLAANDDAIGGTSSAPNFTVCGLTPGHTYYMMNDAFTGTFGNYSISITEIVLQAGAADPLTKICTGDVIDLFTTINGNDAGGVWSAPIAAANASITGSSFNSNGLGYQVFNFQYRMTDGCAYDSIVSQVKVYKLSHAGTDGTLTVCKNEPLDLLTGLSGNVDVDGTWYDPANNPIVGSTVHASQFPGSFNYDYITGNGVCPDDSSNVVVVVLSTCDFLSIQEEVFAGVQLYPNPTTGIIKIDADKAFKIDVTDANGRVVKAEFNSTIGTTTIDLSKAQVGVYFVTLKNTESSKVFRVVVQ